MVAQDLLALGELLLVELVQAQVQQRLASVTEKKRFFIFFLGTHAIKITIKVFVKVPASRFVVEANSTPL